MDYSVFDKIRSGDRRIARFWAHALYTSLKDVLTGNSSNHYFARDFLSSPQEEQIVYVSQTIDALKHWLVGFENHAKRLREYATKYFKLEYDLLP